MAKGSPAKLTETNGAYPASVDRLIAEFARMPGVGRRSAERLANFILRANAPDAMRLANAIEDVKKNIRHCARCTNFADADLCRVCADPRRDHGLVMVVEQPRDLIALEQTGMFRGVYHVLMGRLSPLEGVGADDLTIAALLARIDDPAKNNGGVQIREVVLAMNPTLEGDGTTLYLAQGLARRNIRVTRLARGLPSGGQIELANRAVLGDAIEGRHAV